MSSSARSSRAKQDIVVQIPTRRLGVTVAAFTVASIVGTACGRSPVAPTLAPFATSEYGHFQSGSIRLYYAFDLPEGVERPPLIVLSHGSGRDNTERNARFALHLTQRGFAVLRFDKRGVGKSGGMYSKATNHMTLQAGDLVAAVDFLKGDSRIDASRIGLMGPSQAGFVVPEAAVRSPDVSFVILISGPTVTIQQANHWDEIADDQSRSISELEEIFREFEPSGADLDPRPFLEQLRVPGLWIYGADDRTIPSGPSAEILEEVATTLAKPFTIVTFPGVGHSVETNYWPALFGWYDREIGS